MPAFHKVPPAGRAITTWSRPTRPASNRPSASDRTEANHLRLEVPIPTLVVMRRPVRGRHQVALDRQAQALHGDMRRRHSD
jgi:hypothetical protein